MIQKIFVLLLALVMLTACTQVQNNQDNNQDEQMNHPITDRMGCPPEQEDCEPMQENNNAAIFGSIDKNKITTQDYALGFLARPNDNNSYPGIILIHEWWGLNDNIKQMAEHLASEGYTVLAVDLYQGQVAQTQEQARELVTQVRNDPKPALQTMQDAVQYLREEQQITTLASMGWCFGGGQSLQLALNEQMDATIIYYGTLVTDQQQLESITWPVLGIFGAEDTSIPVSTVDEFEQSLNNLNIENEIHVYDGVGHAFANPSGPNFAPEQTKDAWDKTLAFLNEHLNGKQNNEDVTIIEVSGVNYDFIVNGEINPDIVVTLGTKVRIEFTSDSGHHDWVLDEFNAATERVNASQTTSVEFIADQIGTFEYYCSVGSHRTNGMKGNFIVE